MTKIYYFISKELRFMKNLYMVLPYITGSKYLCFANQTRTSIADSICLPEKTYTGSKINVVAVGPSRCFLFINQARVIFNHQNLK